MPSKAATGTERLTAADFDDDFCGRAVERDARNDALDFAGLGVALTLLDLPREDDVLDVED